MEGLWRLRWREAGHRAIWSVLPKWRSILTVKNTWLSAKKTLQCKYFYVLLRVGFIFTVNTEGILLAGSADGAANQPRPLGKTVRTPTAEAVWGMILQL